MNKRFLKALSGILAASVLMAEPAFVVQADEISAEEIIIEEPVQEIEQPVEEIPANPVEDTPEEIVDEPSGKKEKEEEKIEEIIEEIPLPEQTQPEENDNNNQDLASDTLSENEAEDEGYATGIYSYAEIEANSISDFPESYQSKLSLIQSAHPNWKLVRVNTGLDFNTAVENEMKSGRSLIEKSADSKYVGAVQSGSWCYATKAGVEYYLDPRNFLDEKHILMHSTLAYDSSVQTEDMVKSMVKTNNSFMKGNLPDDSSKTYSNVLFTLGKKNGTNPLYLVARIFQEQGYGGTRLTRGDDGYFNYYNIKGSFSSELAYAKSKGWNTSYKALSEGTSFISSGYINVGQNTLYLQKWDVVDSTPYTHQYMQNIRAPYFESVKLYNQYKNSGVLDKDCVLRIPVFNNMPNSTDTGKSDSKSGDEIELTNLKDLKISESTVTLKAGQDVKLTVNTVPANAYPTPEITWTSSDPTVAGVDFNGRITTFKAGTATITAKTESADKTVGTNGVLTASASVVVEKVTINYRNRAGELLRSRDDAVIGKPVKDYPFSSSECFPENEVMPSVSSNESIGGWYSGQNRSGVKIDKNDLIEGDMDIYPFILHEEKYTFDVKPLGNYTYTGSSIKPEVEVYYGGIELIKGRDYSVSYSYNKNANADITGKQLPAATNKPVAVVKGKGNFTGAQTVEFNITQADLANASAEDVVVDYKSSTKPVYGDPVVYYGSIKLKKGKDYTLTYPRSDGNLTSGSNNYGAYIVPGTYPVVITGMGAYSGSKTVYEVITKKVNVSKLKVSVKKVLYTGEEITLKDLVNNGYLSITNNGVASRIFDPEKMSIDSTDWDVKVELPEDMQSIGKKRIAIYGNSKCGFSGNKVVILNVVAPSSKIELTSFEGYKGTVSINGISKEPYAFTQGGVRPEVVVTLADGTILKEYLDYTVTYKNNTKVASANPPMVVIKGKGAYKGSVSVTFKIEAEDISKCEIVAGDPEYAEKKGGFKPLLSIFDAENGKILKSGKDYAKTATYTYAKDTQVISIENKSNPLTINRKAGESVLETDVPAAGSMITVSVNGIENYKGSISETYTIKQASINKANVFAVTKGYTGDKVYLDDKDLTVVLDKNILSVKDYDIVKNTYSNNVNKGTATVYIRGKGNYGGVKKVTFKISALPILWYFNK